MFVVTAWARDESWSEAAASVAACGLRDDLVANGARCLAPVPWHRSRRSGHGRFGHSIGFVPTPGDRSRFKFSWNVRVGFSETDAQGIVYYGRYLPYFDRARVEYLRDRGMLGMDIGEEGHEFVMRAIAVEYHAPAVFDDLIEVYVRIARIGRTSATYELEAYRVRDGVLLVTATQTLVLVDLEERKAVPIPDSYREAIRAFEGDSLEA
jgi:acyl-CoA thioester hydrolase